MNAEEAVLARRLAHMRWFATGLLFAMAGLFVATSLLISTHPWLGVVAAFAEAGMIGALADWFAVTALFAARLGCRYRTRRSYPREKTTSARRSPTSFAITS